jgi:uncharacterized membrane protein YphA (DoxX/SURF4 family)
MLSRYAAVGFVRTSNARPKERHILQRFFSTFPGSWPGVGLLLLRSVVGGAAAVQGGQYLADCVEPTPWMWALGVLAILSGIALVVGLLTPGSGAVAGVTTVLIVMTWSPSTSTLFIDRVAALFVTADAAAVALLGPGAHSMDAYLFGRREIIIDLPRP